VVLKVAILDFDGTLVESVGIKDRAFERLYGDLDQWPAIREYHLANNHTIRFEKFRVIDEHFLGVEHTPDRAAALAQRFSSLVADEIVASSAVPGARELLDALTASGVHTYLLSMSPADELAGILDRRGIAGEFVGVYAHPWTKVEAVRDILSKEGATPAEAVMVGDSPEDALAAEMCGVRFVGRDSGRGLPSTLEVHEHLLGVRDALFLDAEVT
jgi:phosphoglycolate phosphatase-like HAD superfamily hydrolase